MLTSYTITNILILILIRSINHIDIINTSNANTSNSTNISNIKPAKRELTTRGHLTPFVRNQYVHNSMHMCIHAYGIHVCMHACTHAVSDRLRRAIVLWQTNGVVCSDPVADCWGIAQGVIGQRVIVLAIVLFRHESALFSTISFCFVHNRNVLFIHRSVLLISVRPSKSHLLVSSP